MSFKFKTGDRVVRLVDTRYPEGPVMHGVVTRCYSEGGQLNPGNRHIAYAPHPEVYSITFDPPYENAFRDGHGRYAMQLESDYDGQRILIDD